MDSIDEFLSGQTHRVNYDKPHLLESITIRPGDYNRQTEAVRIAPVNVCCVLPLIAGLFVCV